MNHAFVKEEKNPWKIIAEHLWMMCIDISAYIQKREGLSNKKKPGFWVFSTLSKKKRFKKKIKNVSIGYSDIVIDIKDISF